MEVVREPIDGARLQSLAGEMFGNLVKAVVDIRLGIMVIGGELHADEEALLIGEGSDQASLWGINLYPEQFGTPDFVEFDSMINIRPSQANRSRSVDDPMIRAEIIAVVDRLVNQ